MLNSKHIKMNKAIKSSFIYLIIGTGIVLVIGGLLLLVSLDMRWMAAEAILLSSIISYWISKESKKLAAVRNSLLLTLPFAIFFWLVISKDLPSLWFLVVIFFVASILGSLLKYEKQGLAKALITAMILVSISISTVPLFVGNDLTKYMKQEVESFDLVDHDGDKILYNHLTGKIVVLDFYGTWCKPCIAELPELAKVRDYYIDNDDIVFMVVNADQGGDNLEKAKKFERKFGHGFRFTYDHDGKTYNKLGLGCAGVPSLVIIDKQGYIRMKHIGYNKSETGFVKNMIANINRISKTEF